MSLWAQGHDLRGPECAYFHRINKKSNHFICLTCRFSSVVPTANEPTPSSLLQAFLSVGCHSLAIVCQKTKLKLFFQLLFLFPVNSFAFALVNICDSVNQENQDQTNVSFGDLSSFADCGQSLIVDQSYLSHLDAPVNRDRPTPTPIQL